MDCVDPRGRLVPSVVDRVHYRDVREAGDRQAERAVQLTDIKANPLDLREGPGRVVELVGWRRRPLGATVEGAAPTARGRVASCEQRHVVPAKRQLLGELEAE